MSSMQNSSSEVPLHSRKRKGTFSADITTACDTDAAKFNREILRKIENKLAKDPEIDLWRLIPSTYSARLAARKSEPENDPKRTRTEIEVIRDEFAISKNHSSVPTPTGQVEIVDPLSDTVRSLLGLVHHEAEEADLAQALARVIQSAAVIFQSASTNRHYVARCGNDVALKVAEVQTSLSSSRRDFTEYTSMQFLARYKPEFLAPRPHGLLVADNLSYIFMTYIPGLTLEAAWPSLTESQKTALNLDLNGMILDLQTISRPPGSPLGGVAGEGCKDARRHIRRATSPLYTTEEFWNFLYGQPRQADTVYCRVLHEITFPPHPQRIVFIHGDLRPANVMVEDNGDGKYSITGLIDWEMAGFYPEDYECIRACNNFSRIDTDEWYLYMPSSISPSAHSHSWFSNWIWDPYVV